MIRMHETRIVEARYQILSLARESLPIGRRTIENMSDCRFGAEDLVGVETACSRNRSASPTGGVVRVRS